MQKESSKFEELEKISTSNNLNNAVRSIRKRVDQWIKDGKNAEINVSAKGNSAEIYIKLIE